jgi:hypothetical protein
MVKLGYFIRGLSGYWACRQVADTRGPVPVAGLSPNIEQETAAQLPKPKVLCVITIIKTGVLLSR